MHIIVEGTLYHITKEDWQERAYILSIVDMLDDPFNYWDDDAREQLGDLIKDIPDVDFGYYQDFFRYLEEVLEAVDYANQDEPECDLAQYSSLKVCAKELHETYVEYINNKYLEAVA